MYALFSLQRSMGVKMVYVKTEEPVKIFLLTFIATAEEDLQEQNVKLVRAWDGANLKKANR